MAYPKVGSRRDEDERIEGEKGMGMIFVSGKFYMHLGEEIIATDPPSTIHCG